MDEREEIRPVGRVFPVRKLTLARPRKSPGELMYQLSQYRKVPNPQTKNLISKEMPDVSKTTDLGTVLNTDEFIADVKKRIAFDRAMIIGD